MVWFWVKAMLSGVMIALVATISKRQPAFGALVASLPLVSVLGMIWLWRDTHDTEKLAAHALATFWYVLPSLPMFVIFPVLLRHGPGFWFGLAVSCGVTILCYGLMVIVLARFGIDL